MSTEAKSALKKITLEIINAILPFVRSTSLHPILAATLKVAPMTPGFLIPWQTICIGNESFEIGLRCDFGAGNIAGKTYCNLGTTLYLLFQIKHIQKYKPRTPCGCLDLLHALRMSKEV